MINDQKRKIRDAHASLTDKDRMAKLEDISSSNCVEFLTKSLTIARGLQELSNYTKAVQHARDVESLEKFDELFGKKFIQELRDNVPNAFKHGPVVCVPSVHTRCFQPLFDLCEEVGKMVGFSVVNEKSPIYVLHWNKCGTRSIVKLLQQCISSHHLVDSEAMIIPIVAMLGDASVKESDEHCSFCDDELPQWIGKPQIASIWSCCRSVVRS